MAIADIHVKVNSEIKEKSEDVLSKIGISMSDLVNMTLRRVVYERRVPFDTTVPDKEMPDALSVESVDELEALVAERMRKDTGERVSLQEIREQLGLEKARASA